MRPLAILWDIDGTLIDSEPLHLKALLQICVEHNVDISDYTDAAFIGVNLYNVWQELKDRFSPQTTMHGWIEEINAIYVKLSHELIAIKYAKQVIAKIHRLDIKQVAVSNSSRAIVDINLKVLGVNKFFEFSLSLDDVQKPKPDPQPYQMALEKLNLSNNQVVAIEDSQTGVNSAKSAGITVMGLANNDLKADILIRQLNHIFDHISPGSMHV